MPISTGGGQVLLRGDLPALGRDPNGSGPGSSPRTPELFGPDAVRGPATGADPRAAADGYPELETDQALSRMGREQLWDDVSEEPLEYAGFVAAKVGRVWSHGPREEMRAPVWRALHLVLVSSACSASACWSGGAAGRRW